MELNMEGNLISIIWNARSDVLLCIMLQVSLLLGGLLIRSVNHSGGVPVDVDSTISIEQTNDH